MKKRSVWSKVIIPDLEDALKEAAKKMDRYTAFENRPEAGSHYRSSHFSFASVNTGLVHKQRPNMTGKGADYGKKVAAAGYNGKH